jgi:hypothetical protein
MHPHYSSINATTLAMKHSKQIVYLKYRIKITSNRISGIPLSI